MNLFTRHVFPQLAAYIDGEISSREKSRIEKHLESCPRCQRERDLVESGILMLQHLPSAHAPAAVWTAIESKLPQARPRQSQLMWGWRVAVAILIIAAITAAVHWSVYRSGTSWEVIRIRGTPVVNAKPVRSVTRIRAGEWIETNSFAIATVRLGEIGSVEVAPGTRLVVKAARPSQNRLALTRGSIHAKISAPPKLFLVDTASGTAVDLGCEYSLHTDERGSGLLQVSQGWVSFQWKGLESLVPAGASCHTLPQAGPGVPYFDDALPVFKHSLESLASANFQGAPLDVVLAQARVRDTLTLWHLLSRVGIRDRGRVYERIADLTPVPAGISREKVLALDPATLARWKDELAWTW